MNEQQFQSATTDLAGKNGIVTGASRGLGLAIAEAMGRAGANLLLVARSVEALAEARERALAAGAPQAGVLAADLQEDSAPEAILSEGPIGNVWDNTRVLRDTVVDRS